MDLIHLNPTSNVCDIYPIDIIECRTAYFAEFENRGPGAMPEQRAGFVKKLSDADAKPFITLGHINASGWLLPPPTL